MNEENEISEERISMSLFNEKVALDTYKMCCEPKAAFYLSQVKPPVKETKSNFERSSKNTNVLDLSDLAGVF